MAARRAVVVTSGVVGTSVGIESVVAVVRHKVNRVERVDIAWRSLELLTNDGSQYNVAEKKRLTITHRMLLDVSFDDALCLTDQSL